MVNDFKHRLTDSHYEIISDTYELSTRRKNSRLLIKDIDHSEITDPIIGYAQEPILSLIEACVPLINIVHDIIVYAKVALDSIPNVPADDLTRDESASIHLYTMEWNDSHDSLYTCLNRTLRSNDREQLRPWFKYLKLFLSAVVKIPCNPPQTVWRGVRKNCSDQFPKGAQVIWWGCSSTTTSLDVLKSDLYLGKTGERTLFSIEIINGRSICAHSYFKNEEEILLLPGTYTEVQSQLDPAPDLHVIHLKQIVPNEMLLQPPFEGAQIYPKLQRSWYTRKRFLISLGILMIVCIIAAVLGGVLGHTYGTKKPDLFVNWNGNNWASACDFHDDSFFNITSLPAECGVKCSTLEQCTHFTWIVSNGGMCLLKAGNVSKDDAFVTDDPSMLCGVVYRNHYRRTNATVSWDGHNWAQACAFINNDLTNIAVSPQVCSIKCVETNGCTHYVWSRWAGGTCFLKKGNVSKDNAIATNDSTMVCGIINGSQYDGPNSTVLWNGRNWAMSCDFIGNSLSDVATTSELCGETCAQRKECTHFTWTSLNGGTCSLKSGNISKDDAFFINDPAIVCGILNDNPHYEPNSTILWHRQNWAMSCDFVGNDIANASTTPDLCGRTCIQTENCTHFTWTSFNGGTCSLKSGNVTKNDAFHTNDRTMVCGIINDGSSATIQWDGQNWAMSCDFVGTDFANATITSELCGETCLQTQGCTHFTWTSFNGGTCWMKNGNVTKNDAVHTNDRTMVCGILNDGSGSTIQWDGRNWALSCDFIDNSLSNVTTTAELCGLTCVQTQGCTHFTWTSFNGGTCWMKSGNVSKSDAFHTNDPTMVCGVMDP